MQCVELSNRLDTALSKNVPLAFIPTELNVFLLAMRDLIQQSLHGQRLWVRPCQTRTFCTGPSYFFTV